MTLEDLIYRRLCNHQPLKDCLATYADAPAVFYQSAPDDTSDGWKEKTQYPRIDYVIDYQANPERKTSGVLTLNIYCSSKGAAPEDIEPTVQSLLRDVFFTTSDRTPYAMAWARSDAFDIKNDAPIIGVTVTFDIYAFPSHETVDPDPVQTMNHYIEEKYPSAIVIGGNTALPEEFQPTADAPVFYFRLAGLDTDRETNTVAWMNATIACHIFAGGQEVKYMKALADSLALAGEVIMPDTSPMFIKRLQADAALNALVAGQLRLSTQFGILRRAPLAHLLDHSEVEYRA